MTSRTIGQLLYSLRQGDLLLPNFQRPFVWNPERWQSLMASIILEYPVGQALIGTEADSHIMSVRKPLSIPEKTLHETFIQKANLKPEDLKNIKVTQYLQKGKAYSCEYLLDGQQRLTALDLMLGTAFHCASNELNRNYRLRWFLNLNKLGLENLQWPNTRDMPHEEACEAIVFVKYKKTDKNSPYYYEKSDSDLSDFCTVKTLQTQVGIEEGIYVPLDKLYSEDENSNSLQFDPTFIIDLFEERQEIILNQTQEGKKLKENKSILEHEVYKERLKNLKREFSKWRSKLEATLNNIINFEFPVLEVPSKEFDRLAGIFSVINMGGVELSTFDLLVAKTTTVDSSLREIVKSACVESSKDFKKYLSIIPESAKELSIDDFWNIGKFLGEKNTDEIVKGREFPESIARSFAQTIVLHAKLSKALGDDWCTRSNALSSYRENKTDPDLITNRDYKEAARSILRIDDWGYSDKLILALSREEVQKVQAQAAKQLLRAYFFMKARLGILKLSYFPYRQMDLVLATVLTDSVWKKLNQDPTGNIMQKLQWWYWGSIFGGAYQKAYSSIDKRVLADIPRLLAYISKPSIKWEDISNLCNEETQYSWKGTELKNSNFTEIPIISSNGKSGNRFEIICNADGYSTKEALMTSSNKTIGLAIRAFTIRNGLPDFKYRDKKDNKLQRRAMLHTGRDDLQADHLYAMNSWYKFTGEKVNDRNADHPINSPLNYSWISAQANRYWSDNPSFMKLELRDALAGNQDSIDFLHHHLLSIEAVENEYRDVLLESEEREKESAKKVFTALLEKRFEKLRQQILDENPEL
ncbi:MAG: DUF262 domain-containing protein [Prochloraceae cyanobacterium]|nr:DUF262 domain-containing protein [Prochloraceae cyanobacterium]